MESSKKDESGNQWEDVFRDAPKDATRSAASGFGYTLGAGIAGALLFVLSKLVERDKS